MLSHQEVWEQKQIYCFKTKEQIDKNQKKRGIAPIGSKNNDQ